MNKTHGMTGTRIYKIWWSMIGRCKDTWRKSYKYYGGKGIVVCSKWQKFDGFFEDMGSTYQDGMSLERLDNDQNYCKENCTWVEIEEQPRNRSANRGPDGKPLTEYCAANGLSYHTIQNRLRRGWDYERAIKTPVRKYKSEEGNEDGRE